MREGAAGALVSYVERPSERSYRTSRGRWSARIVRREARPRRYVGSLLLLWMNVDIFRPRWFQYVQKPKRSLYETNGEPVIKRLSICPLCLTADKAALISSDDHRSHHRHHHHVNHVVESRRHRHDYRVSLVPRLQ